MQENKTKILSEQIINCIDSALSNYGETTSQLLLANFETRFNLRKEDAVTHVAQFEELLGDIFGTGMASSPIKQAILKELDDHFQISSAEDKSSKEDSLSAGIKQILRERS